MSDHSADLILRIPVAKLAAHWNPFVHEVWPCGHISEYDVQAALRKPQQNPTQPLAGDRPTRYHHACRIAALLQHGWSKPIDIDVGVPSLGHVVNWPIVDGNHRLAAAIYRRDEFISASISGELSYAETLFEVPLLVAAGYRKDTES